MWNRQAGASRASAGAVIVIGRRYGWKFALIMLVVLLLG